jgi:outer membrane protein OmpA-like peptidoglycan-associated protein
MRSPWTSVLLVVVALVTSACATKGWVNELMGQKGAQIDLLYARTDATLTEVGDGARVAKERADAAYTRAETAHERADGAFGRADAAFGRADEVNGRVTRLWNSRYKRDLVDTLQVQFAFDRADLSDGAQTALLQVTKELKENPLLTVDLEGYTDPTGPRDYNVGLSQRRVESVRRFLVGNGADLSRINSVGLGPLQGTEKPALQRRVTVRLMINPVDCPERGATKVAPRTPDLAAPRVEPGRSSTTYRFRGVGIRRGGRSAGRASTRFRTRRRAGRDGA